MGSYDHEPWFHGGFAREAVRRVLELRYRLLPYIYSLFYEHYAKGYPVMRPLLFEFPDDEETYAIDDEFMLGPFLLVAPVLKEGARSREVYLPRGRWYDFWSGEAYEGPARVRAEAPLDRVPLFVRGGAVVPMWPPMSYVGERKPDPLYLHVYPGDGSFALYEDDGETLDYTKGVYALTRFQVSERDGELTLRKSPREGGYEPGREFVIVVLHGAGGVVKALKDGSELKPLASPEEEREGVTRVEGKPAVKLREAKEGWELKILMK